MQDAYVRDEPKHFFVPPYVGPSGWLGLRLDEGIRLETRRADRARGIRACSAAKARQATPENAFRAGAKKASRRRMLTRRTAPRGKQILASMRKDLPCST